MIIGCNIVGSCISAVPIAVGKRVTIVEMSTPIRGRTLDSTPPIAPKRFSPRTPKSEFSSNTPVRKFCHVAPSFVMEPEMVDEPSSAVVPAMPISVCITWMAWVTSAKLPSS